MTHLFELEKEDFKLVEEINYLIGKETIKPMKVGDTIILQCGNEEAIKLLTHISTKDLPGLKPNYRIINLKDKE